MHGRLYLPILWLLGLWLAGTTARGAAGAEVLVREDFGTNLLPAGTSIARQPSGLRRLTIDPAGLLSTAGGALRLPPPSTNAWGFLGISHGPVAPRPGLGVAWRIRLGDVDAWPEGDAAKFVAGWFEMPNSTNPIPNAKGFVFQRALDAPGGMLGVAGPRGVMPLLNPVMAVDAQLFALFRSDSIMLYAASARGVRGFGAYPYMRPVGLLPLPGWRSAFAGLTQRYQRDTDHPTVLDGIRIAMVPEFGGWAGSANYSEAAPMSSGRLPSPSNVVPADPAAADDAIRFTDGGMVSVTRLNGPAGLVAVTVETGERPGGFELLWRWRDRRNHWSADVGKGGTQLAKVVEGRRTVLASEGGMQPLPGSSHRYWISDDGTLVQLWRDDVPLLWAVDPVLATASEAGVRVRDGSDSKLHHFEAHLRSIAIPPSLLLGAPYQRMGSNLVAGDDFTGSAVHLAGRPTPRGALRWQRHGGPDLDREFVALVGGTGARATRENSSVVRYFLEWPSPRFADVACELTSPAAPIPGRAGLILWQDDRNFIASYWDSVEGRHGVWLTRDGHWVPMEVTGIGAPPGATQRIRLTSDGDNYVLLVDDEPVMLARVSDAFTGLPPLQIKMVGLCLGRRDGRGDGGTLFQKFEARR